MNKILFIGPPGCGKGTQANILKQYSYVHISSGDILRKEIQDNTKFGLMISEFVSSGGLVPDDLMINRITQKLNHEKFVLDGFPRTIEQAVKLDEFVKFDVVVEFVCNSDIIINRILNRTICPTCNISYNNAGICNVDGAELIRRADDDINKLKKRLSLYDSNIGSLRKFYNMLKIDASLPVHEVSDILLSYLKEHNESIK